MAQNGKLPEQIDEYTEPSFNLVRELVEEGYLDAIDASSMDGYAYINTRITLPGREYLEKLIQRGANESTKERATLEKSTNPLYQKPNQKAIWLDIEQEYELTKKMFGKKINFVKDQTIRDAIFRDVADAYFLAKSGINKPAAILAGGVVEELLRSYLQTKGIKPREETFEKYIQACEANGLLKLGVSRLTDSIRHFRNMVHISKEIEPKYAISKPTAIGAVANIFTLCNDFE